jgi:hypothetical protein
LGEAGGDGRSCKGSGREEFHMRFHGDWVIFSGGRE